MKLHLLSILALLLASSAIAQQTAGIGRNRAYLEVGGMGFQYSLNYERKIPITRAFSLSAGVLVTPSLLPINGNTKRTSFSPRVGLQCRFNYNINRHEVGLGYDVTGYAYKYKQPENGWQDWRAAYFVQLGYGYNFKKGLYIGGYFTPLIKDGLKYEFTPWGGLRLGYNFGGRSKK